MAFTHGSRSIPEILSDVVSQTGALMRTEGRLVRAEMSENIAKAALALGFIVGGAVLLIPALTVLMQAIVVALSDQGMSTATAALITGGVVLIIGVVLLMVGINRLKPEQMIPDRTIHQLQQDATMAKNQVRESDELHRAA